MSQTLASRPLNRARRRRPSGRIYHRRLDASQFQRQRKSVSAPKTKLKQLKAMEKMMGLDKSKTEAYETDDEEGKDGAEDDDPSVSEAVGTEDSKESSDRGKKKKSKLLPNFSPFKRPSLMPLKWGGTKNEKPTAESDNEMAEILETLLNFSRSMAEVTSQSLDAMHHLANDIVSTAMGMRSLVDAQRSLAMQRPSMAFQAAPLATTTAAPYQRKSFGTGKRRGTVTKAGLQPLAKLIVEIKVVFMRISEIDTLNQQFEAELYIQARWSEKRFSGLSESQLSKVEFYQCTDPQLKLLNVVGDLDMDKTSMVLRYEPESISPVLLYMWHIKGIFRERMELQHFPFDVQELSMVISSELPIDKVELVGDFFRASSVNRAALQTNQDWSNYRHVEITRDISTQEMEATNKHSVLVVAARIKRRLGYYFWNVIIIVLLIQGMTLVILAIDPTGSTRLVLSVTLFLVAVAFKLVVKSTLPNIAYLTYLDLYVVFVMAYLFLWSASNALMCHLTRFRDRQRILEYDEIAQSCLIGFLVLFHLLFLIYIQVTALSRRREMNKLDLKYRLAKALRRGQTTAPVDANYQPTSV